MAHEMGTPLAWVMSRDAEIRRVIALNLRKRGMRCAELTAPPGESEPPAVKPQVITLDVEPGAGWTGKRRAHCAVLPGCRACLWW